MARQGLNCTLSYAEGKTTRKYRVRCTALSYGYEQIFTESQARVTRGFYPHQVAPTDFAIEIALNGDAERDSFNNYMMRFANYILDPGRGGIETPQMTVVLPERNFRKVGVPTSGVMFGKKIGQVLYAPQIVFAISGEGAGGLGDTVSSVSADRAYFKQPESKYFYPSGLQLKGGESPVELQNLQSYQDVINGAAISGSSNATVGEAEAND